MHPPFLPGPVLEKHNFTTSHSVLPLIIKNSIYNQ